MSLLPLGILLPASTLDSTWFAVLSAFVAINTVMYTALAIAKIAPKIYVSDLVHRRDRRATNRSIHPTADEAGRAHGRVESGGA
jgi:hypothetical protein